MASTQRAYAICDICGFRFKHRQLKKNSYGLLVCPSDWEGSYDLKNHWQNKNPDTSDNQFVRNPRPPSFIERNIDWEEALSLWEETDNYWNMI